jgi:hypothetical protein
MYMLVIPPTPPPSPPSLGCQWFSLGCPPPPVPVNPDSLQQLEPYLATQSGAGLGDYERKRYQYLFHPRLTTHRKVGMGCSGGHCDCGGACKGMGLFDSGTDISGWGMPEWSIVGLTGIGALYAMSALASGGRSVARAYRRRRAA